MKQIFSLLLLLLMTVPAFAQERITRFISSVGVDKEGTATVQEEISVWAEHQRIRRGIYRDLPSTKQEPVEILSLEMDGTPHPYFLQRQGDNLRVNFGNDEYISRGAHTYLLRYKMKNVVRFFPEYDEIYWNVTGNKWDFRIDQALFKLTLPQGAQPDETRISSYIGYQGQKGIAAHRYQLRFWTDAPLAPYQGMTVAVPWQKGVVPQPKQAWYKKYASLWPWVLAGVVMVALWIYYFLAWQRVGKDPQARVIRQFEPPEGFSPAMAAYVYNFGLCSNLLSVVISSLAVKGALNIEEKKKTFGKEYVLHLQNMRAPMLAKEEHAVLWELFGTSQHVTIEEENRDVFVKAQRVLARSLQGTCREPYLRINAQYNMPTLLALALFALAYYPILQQLLPLFLCALVLLISNFLFARIGKKNIFIWLLYVVGMCLVLQFAWHLIPNKNIPLYLGVCLTAISGGLFACWIQAYTPLGRQKMNEIEGFKEYLEIGEGGRVAASNPAQKAQIFCDYLPYAYALGVGSQWGKNFSNKIDEALLTQTMHERGLQVPQASSIGTSMAAFGSAVRSYARAKTNNGDSYSSGSSGGGFSGGGSAGGGGGGR